MAQGEELASDGKTPVFFAQGSKLLGVIAVADVVTAIQLSKQCLLVPMRSRKNFAHYLTKYDHDITLTGRPEICRMHLEITRIWIPTARNI